MTNNVKVLHTTALPEFVSGNIVQLPTTVTAEVTQANARITCRLRLMVDSAYATETPIPIPTLCHRLQAQILVGGVIVGNYDVELIRTGRTQTIEFSCNADVIEGQQVSVLFTPSIVTGGVILIINNEIDNYITIR